MWKSFKGTIAGTQVEGDPKVRPTTIWNWLPMKLWGRKTTVVFRVSFTEAQRGYRIGYKPLLQGGVVGRAMYNGKVFHNQLFRVRIGRESCIFFAVGVKGSEVQLDFVAREDIKTGEHQETPLR
jgi:hypothetical protein